jgi:hypothetical protein
VGCFVWISNYAQVQRKALNQPWRPLETRKLSRKSTQPWLCSRHPQTKHRFLRPTTGSRTFSTLWALSCIRCTPLISILPIDRSLGTCYPATRQSRIDRVAQAIRRTDSQDQSKRSQSSFIHMQIHIHTGHLRSQSVAPRAASLAPRYACGSPPAVCQWPAQHPSPDLPRIIRSCYPNGRLGSYGRTELDRIAWRHPIERTRSFAIPGNSPRRCEYQHTHPSLGQFSLDKFQSTKPAAQREPRFVRTMTSEPVPGCS